MRPAPTIGFTTGSAIPLTTDHCQYIVLLIFAMLEKNPSPSGALAVGKEPPAPRLMAAAC